ncbi:MAG: hypothetical protein M3Y07_11370 [Acidobacteriota bacterium]|nr:hypothetical protein [Acidobacteriota bacterium]
MPKILLSFLFIAGGAFSQSAPYKMEPAGPPPSELAPDMAAGLQKQGAKIVNGSGATVCEVWFRSVAPSGPKSTEDAISLPTIPVGSYIGAIRFPVKASDRRGQNLKPGVYTMRYGLYPVNGDHQGVAPQRDFALLIPAADDKDPKSTPTFENMVAMSTKASGTPHPAVLSLSSGSGGTTFTKEAEHDWTLNTKMGDLPVSIILIGKVEG